MWRTRFGRHYPAMGLFGVTGLAVPEAVVELMGIAVVGLVSGDPAAALDSHLTDEQRELYARTHELAASELAAIAEAGDPSHVNRELLRALVRPRPAAAAVRARPARSSSA